MEKQAKIFFLIIIILILALILVSFFIYWGQKNNNAKNNNIVGNDREEHGCLISAGYSWCAAKNKCLRVFEEFCPDAIAVLVAGIKKDSGVDLIADNSVKTFTWRVGDDITIAGTEVTGVSYSAPGVSFAAYNKIRDYLGAKLEEDKYNAADGANGSLSGYYGAYFVCQLSFDRPAMPPDSGGPADDNLRVNLVCGFFNKNNISNFLAEQAIKEMLMKKYQKSADELTVEIKKINNTNAAGSIGFGAEGTPGGLFLAVKVDDDWKIVYEGNGSIDCDLMRSKYQFSNEMLQPEFCD